MCVCVCVWVGRSHQSFRMRVYLSDYAFNSNRTIFSFNLKILYEFYNFLKYKSSILIENR
jgi:hypothetical protein